MCERDKQEAGTARPDETDAARALAAAVEAGLGGLGGRGAAGGGGRAATGDLLDCAQQLAGEELMIRGSTGQGRPHPLLKTLAELRREISDGLKELTFRAEQRALYARMNAAHQRARNASRAKEQP